MKEIWKDIPDYEGMYQVSNLGRVKSLSRYTGNGNTGFISKEIILKQRLSTSGYLYVALCKSCVGKKIMVHQLVAMAFLKHKPNGLEIVVDHINTIKTDNCLKNLQLITHRENISKDKDEKKYSSKYIGVNWDKCIKKWRVRIQINGKRECLGYFKDEDKAGEVYSLKLKEIL